MSNFYSIVVKNVMAETNDLTLKQLEATFLFFQKFLLCISEEEIYSQILFIEIIVIIFKKGIFTEII